jgi:beta-phosphoglucomutase
VTYGLIFDMDGVLVDSAMPHYESWRRLGLELGCEVSEERFWPTFGRQNRDVIPDLFHILDAERIERLGERKEVLYREIIRVRVPAMDGAVELIRACHAAGFKLAIGSSGPPENVDVVLAGMGVDALFEARITSQQVTRGKPDPQVFSLAADALGLAPRQCAVVEDAPVGVQAALAAGTAAIVLVSGHPADKLRSAHLMVDSLRELTPERISDLIRSRNRTSL